MYDRVLIPVDGSEVSSHAAREGFRLAKALGSKVTLLYVIDLAIVTIPEAETGLTNYDVIHQTFKEQGERVLGGLSALAGQAGVVSDAVVAEGDVHDEIINKAEDMKAGLIVMGTHGRRGLNRLLLGSVAESVARRAHCAVLLIRPE
ncbi:MAG: universal stress protein [Nitrospirae bacterium]|nr:universal stress protein [Nitrospirota bacterium]